MPSEALHHGALTVAAVVFHVERAGLVEEHVFLGIEQTVLVHVEHREDIAAAGGGFFNGYDTVHIRIPAFDEMGTGLALLREGRRGGENGRKGESCRFHG
jgi:hypothetical protein